MKRVDGLEESPPAVFRANSSLDNGAVSLGITGKDYTLTAASKAAMRGVTILKAIDDKTRELVAFSGEAANTGKEDPIGRAHESHVRLIGRQNQCT